jgi:hypothetical protein
MYVVVVVLVMFVNVSGIFQSWCCQICFWQTREEASSTVKGLLATNREEENQP